MFLFLRVANWDNGELRCKLVDFDEFAMPLEKCNRTQGWALVCRRVPKEGHYHLSYHKVGNELTCLMAIEPGDRSVAQRDSWEVWKILVGGLGVSKIEEQRSMFTGTL